MKQALVMIDYKSLPFAQRLELVKSHISKQVTGLEQNKKMALQARLWCAWLRREVLL